MATNVISNTNFKKLLNSITLLVDEIHSNKESTVHSEAHNVPQVHTDIPSPTIKVLNGGGRSVSYSSTDFYQLIYDQNKSSRTDIDSIKENIIGMNETISDMNQDVSLIKLTLETNMKTVSQDISKINTSLPERFDKKVKKYTSFLESVLKTIEIIAYLSAIFYFLGNILFKTGANSIIQR